VQAKILNPKKLIISKQHLQIKNVTLDDEPYLVTCLFEDNKMVEINCKKSSDESILGNIYIGRVQNIVKNVNAAFIDIGNGKKGFYSLEDYKSPVFIKKNGKKPLSIGDELLVQVAKDPIKTKDPVLSTNLNFTGKYLVLTSENHTLGISSKIGKESRTRFKTLLSNQSLNEYGIIIRTNAKDASDESIFNELSQLEHLYQETVTYAKNRVTFTCLYEAPRDEMKLLKDLDWKDLDEIVTDDIEIFESFVNYLKQSKTEDFLLSKIRFYEDDNFSLVKMYNIEKQLECALKKNVWLKSGAYLVIEQTEALTVIDVNSGKNIAKKSAQENHFKINIEAAKEIAAQLRLRNISGICIIDFISMDNPEYEIKLMEEMSNLCKKDKIPTQLIDITKLGLVELTRKKVKKSLIEQIYTQKNIDE